MRVLVRIFGALAVAAAAAGCIQTKQDYTLNPGGSGKVVVEATFQAMQINLGNQKPNSETKLKKAVRETLKKSTGVAAWRDVEYKTTDKGKVFFKGTAYFDDLSRVQFKFGGVDIDMLKPTLTQDAQGRMVLALKSKKKGKKGQKRKAPAQLTDDEVAIKVQDQKAKYLQAKPMMTAMLSEMKIEMSFRLPGKVVEVTNLKTTDDGRLKIDFEGAKLLQIMDGLVADDQWMRKMVTSGRDVMGEGPAMDEAMNEKLYGEKGPVRAVIAGNLKPLFDYKAELAAAKKEYEKITKDLGMAPPIPVAPAKGGGLKSLRVGGIRLVYFSDWENRARPFNDKKGYTLSLVGKLPGSVLKVSGGELERAVADTGEDLMPEQKWDRKIHFPQLSRDETTVIFEVGMRLPGRNVKGIKEVAGTLEYLVAGAIKKVDLGMMEFKAGAKGQALNAVVKSVKASRWQKGMQEMELQLECSYDAVKAVKLFDAAGAELKLAGSSRSGGGNRVTFNCSRRDGFPPRGKVVVEIHDKLQKYRIPFCLRNVSLLGKPLE
ncbi:MAG: hypothetical protein GXP25_19260 [Planctomycetes bacterium]|nr:hypothetical protein [Planctomycetota bacterium]